MPESLCPGDIMEHEPIIKGTNTINPVDEESPHAPGRAGGRTWNKNGATGGDEMLAHRFQIIWF